MYWAKPLEGKELDDNYIGMKKGRKGI